MVNDPVGDMLAQIKNAYLARKSVVTIAHSNMKEAVAHILSEEGYLSSVTVAGETAHRIVALKLMYHGTTPALTDIKRKSKPGLRIYVRSGAIPSVVGGMGITILSTPEGIMSGKKASKKHIGGELICEVW